MSSPDRLAPEACYRAASSRDRRFDGVFYVGVRTTGIYCRPSCPARTPKPANVTFHPTSAAAQAAGFRACKRCLPDATPGSSRWDVSADLAGRAMRLIADGVVDREGVEGLAERLGYTSRHLSRLLTGELGAGPLALARARRAQTARVLLESSHLSCADLAFASGFASLRQFNQTLREVYDATPTQLRAARGRARSRAAGAPDGAETGTPVRVRLAVRTPYAGQALLDFLAFHLVPGVEVAGVDSYARTLDLPHAPGTVHVDLSGVLEATGPGEVAFAVATLWLGDLRDTSAAVERTRRLLDADCDPVSVDEHLGADDVLAESVAAAPACGCRGRSTARRPPYAP